MLLRSCITEHVITSAAQYTHLGRRPRFGPGFPGPRQQSSWHSQQLQAQDCRSSQGHSHGAAWHFASLQGQRCRPHPRPHGGRWCQRHDPGWQKISMGQHGQHGRESMAIRKENGASAPLVGPACASDPRLQQRRHALASVRMHLSGHLLHDRCLRPCHAPMMAHS